MSNKPNLYQFYPKLYDFTDKERSASDIIRYMLARTNQMFEYEGLPDTVPKRNLEFMLQTNGNVFWTKVDGDIYVFTGGVGGVPDAYYMPTLYTVANPYLKFNANLEIGVDGVLMPSDSMFMGLAPMLSKYAAELVEIELSLTISAINSRITSLLSAGTDAAQKAAEKYIKDIERGKLGIIADSAFMESIKSQPYATAASANQMQELIEARQYVFGSMLHEIGINAPFNMKRESINSAESGLNDNAVIPFCEDMLKSRKNALEKVNEMFGTDIKVEFSSVWKNQSEELELKTKILESEVVEKDVDIVEESEGGVDDVETNKTE